MTSSRCGRGYVQILLVFHGRKGKSLRGHGQGQDDALVLRAVLLRRGRRKGPDRRIQVLREGIPGRRRRARRVQGATVQPVHENGLFRSRRNPRIQALLREVVRVIKGNALRSPLIASALRS